MNVSISRDGTEIGEWTEDQVRAFYKEGQLLPTDYYWKEGMSEWAELSKMIKPVPPSSIKRESASEIKKNPSQEAEKPFLEKGIGRLGYFSIVLFVLICISGAKSEAETTYRYDNQTAGFIELFVGLAGFAVILFAVYLRLKNIGNSTAKSVLYTILALIPLLSIPVALACLFCATGYASRPKTTPAA